LNGVNDMMPGEASKTQEGNAKLKRLLKVQLIKIFMAEFAYKHQRVWYIGA